MGRDPGRMAVRRVLASRVNRGTPGSGWESTDRTHAKQPYLSAIRLKFVSLSPKGAKAMRGIGIARVHAWLKTSPKEH